MTESKKNTIPQKVFGMKPESGRWLYVVIGLILNLCLGTVYAWSVFRKPVEKFFSIGATQSLMPFILFLAFFAILMPFGGRLIQKLGPKIVGIIGGALVGIGWIASGFANNILLLDITYGVVAGAGVGLIYGGPIAVSTKWFPDWKGLAVGLTLFGFGASALVTAPLAQSFINSKGVLPTFLILGIAFIVILILGSLLLKVPPADWKPAGWKPSAKAAVSQDFTTKQMLKKSSFYGLWICYIIGALAGLMAIGISSPVGQEIVKLTPATAAVMVSIFAVFNGIGRPIFGWLTDKINPRNSALVSFVLIGLAALGMWKFAGEGNTVLYAFCFSALWLSFGGWLAIAPTATATFFGNKDYSTNYGIVFTAYGVGAIVGNLIAGQIRDLTGSYTNAFLPVAILAIIGIIIAVLMLKPPKKA
jgi:OFA family oxalate/formate antiporter-like MFS transporter